MGRGPPKEMKNASVRHPLSMEPLPFPCHPDRSEAEEGPAVPRTFRGNVFRPRSHGPAAHPR